MLFTLAAVGHCALGTVKHCTWQVAVGELGFGNRQALHIAGSSGALCQGIVKGQLLATNWSLTKLWTFQNLFCKNSLFIFIFAVPDTIL